MIENSTLKVGGNTILVWLGKKMEKLSFKKISEAGAKMIINNSTKLVTNPIAKLYNPFTLIISFTVDTNLKYQIVLQGDYKQKYKDCIEGNINLTEKEIFLIINQHPKNWFKKD